MAFIVQDDTGTVAGATAYIDVPFFDDYHGDRGTDISGLTTQQKQQAIIKATSYIDARFRSNFQGLKVNDPTIQTTEFPRVGVKDKSGFTLDELLPVPVKQACAEYAFRASSSALLPDPETDLTGGKIIRKREKTGPIEEETEFSEGGSVFLLKPYPLADLLISELLKPTSTILRA